MKVFIKHVGANSTTANFGIMSPLFPDNTFEFVPIPEFHECPFRFKKLSKESEEPMTKDLKEIREWIKAQKNKKYHPQFLTYKDIRCFNDPTKALSQYLPSEVRNLPVHNDPEFETWTFGGVPEKTYLKNERGLNHLRPGDYLFFLSTLTEYANNEFIRHQWNYYLVGYFLVKDLISIKNSLKFGDDQQIKAISNNAHFRQFLATGLTEGSELYVVIGDSERSQRFKHLIPFTRDVIGEQNRRSFIGKIRTARCFFKNKEAKKFVNWAIRYEKSVGA